MKDNSYLTVALLFLCALVGIHCTPPTTNIEPSQEQAFESHQSVEKQSQDFQEQDTIADASLPQTEEGPEQKTQTEAHEHAPEKQQPEPEVIPPEVSKEQQTAELPVERIPEKVPPPQIKGDLIDWIKRWNYGKDKGNNFTPIPSVQKVDFRNLIESLLKRDIPKVMSLSAKVGMKLNQFLDTPSQKRFWLLHEIDLKNPKGKGIYVVPLNPLRRLVIQAPHPIKDTNTNGEAAHLTRHLLPTLMMVASLNRCNHSQATSCSGSTSQCGGGRYRISDAAHHVESYFHIAHTVVAQSSLKLVAIQLHGFARKTDEPSVYLSNGTKIQAKAGSIGLKLRDEINKVLKANGLFSSRSCNDPKGKSVRLCGTTNVQGRHTNGVSLACTQSAKQATDRFIHVEQRIRLRTGTKPGPGYLINPLKALFPQQD